MTRLAKLRRFFKDYFQIMAYVYIEVIVLGVISQKQVEAK